MQSVLIVIHLLVVIALVTVVLLQRSEGGTFGTGGGGGSFMTGRAQANALSRATAILATLYFVSALTMSVIAGWNRAPKSIIDSTQPTTSQKAPAPAQAPTNVLDQLKALEKGAPTAPQTK